MCEVGMIDIPIRADLKTLAGDWRKLAGALLDAADRIDPTPGDSAEPTFGGQVSGGS